MSCFDFPAWATPLLGGKPPPDPTAAMTADQPPKPPAIRRGRGRPPGAKNKAK